MAAAGQRMKASSGIGNPPHPLSRPHQSHNEGPHPPRRGPSISQRRASPAETRPIEVTTTGLTRRDEAHRGHIVRAIAPSGSQRRASPKPALAQRSHNDGPRGSRPARTPYFCAPPQRPRPRLERGQPGVIRVLATCQVPAGPGPPRRRPGSAAPRTGSGSPGQAGEIPPAWPGWPVRVSCWPSAWRSGSHPA